MAFGSVALALGFPALLRVGDLRNLPAGVKAICAPWWDLFVAQALRSLALLLGGAISLRARGAAVYIFVLLLIALFAAFFSWVRADAMRTLLRVGEGMGGDRYRRVHMPALIFLRGVVLVVLAVGLMWVALRSGTHAWMLQLSNGALGDILRSTFSLLAVVLVDGLGLLGLVDIFQMAEDVAVATSGGNTPRSLDFKWLKALIGLMTLLLWLGGAATVVVALKLLAELPRGGMVVVLIFVPLAVMMLLILAVVPRFIRNLLRIEANMRPEGLGRVSVAPGFPGISAYLIWGRILAWFSVFGVLAGTALVVIVASDHLSGGAILGIVVGGLGTALGIAIVLGSFPDFLSLLLTLERNLRRWKPESRSGVEMDPLAVAPTLAGDPENPWLTPELLEEAIVASGDRVVAAPVVPAGEGGVVLQGWGARGRYQVVRRGQSLILLGPAGVELGQFEEGRFVGGRAPQPDVPGLDVTSWEQDVYRTPAIPMERLIGTPGAQDVSGMGEREEECRSAGEPDTKTREQEVSFEDVESVRADDVPPSALDEAGPPPAVAPSLREPGTGAGTTKEPLIDVERTPRVSESVSRSPAPSPPPPAARVRTFPRQEPGAIPIASIPISVAMEAEHVLVALVEILLLRHEIRQLGTGTLRSHLAGSSVELEGVGLDAALLARLQQTFRSELDRTVRFATSLMESNVFELKRYSAGRVRCRRAADGHVLAPGWTGGAMPPLGGIVVSRSDGKLVYRGKPRRRYPIKLAVLQGEDLVIYGIRM
ncbi:MAG: hypothetical protein GXP47_05160 [Acidobacteria bacterium]|nr:hypothetical protein [Acidobacteriota bacterium]